MSKQAPRYPEMPAGVNPFDWIIRTAAENRARKQAQHTIQKAQQEAAKRPRDRDPAKLARWARPNSAQVPSSARMGVETGKSAPEMLDAWAEGPQAND